MSPGEQGEVPLWPGQLGLGRVDTPTPPPEPRRRTGGRSFSKLFLKGVTVAVSARGKPSPYKVKPEPAASRKPRCLPPLPRLSPCTHPGPPVRLPVWVHRTSPSKAPPSAPPQPHLEVSSSRGPRDHSRLRSPCPLCPPPTPVQIHHFLPGPSHTPSSPSPFPGGGLPFAPLSTPPKF